MMQKTLHGFLVLMILLSVGCDNQQRKLFTELKPDATGVHFTNNVEETREKNVMLYEYYYNGGGVAAADFNNDGLTDLYFTGNSVSNKLYLNKGELKFEDVTTDAQVGGRSGWKTGVTVVDINADGWLDFYLCYSGPEPKENLYNELYINSGCKPGGVPVFTERAKEYGLDAPFTFSTQATFFDMDRDGDLDMFLSNHGHRYFSPFFNTRIVRNKRHLQFGNRLYRNDGNHFFEISDQAGIHGGGINFGLSACVSDVNLDGWMDLYVTNDFEEQDYLYLNQKDNTFREVNRKATGHTSKFSMGSDAADINNDILPDLLVVDMLPESLQRQKTLKGPDEYDRYTLMVDSGFHHQNMRNTLQLHQGVTEDGIPQFSEIGQLAGIHKTDWSWASLIADFDNDGYKDIFITNGFLRDFTNMDFLKYTYQDAAEAARKSNSIVPVFELIKEMPSTTLANFIFRNEGDYTFSDKRLEWGVDDPKLSFGAVYVDLDNDGDLDLVTNNTNESASIFENNGNELHDNKYVKIKLIGSGANSYAIGAKVVIQQKGKRQMQELIPSRGFQSSCDYIMTFGLGEGNERIDINISWPNGQASTVLGVATNTLITIRQEDVQVGDTIKDSPPAAIFEDITSISGLEYVHKENRFVDFKFNPLILHEYSKSGPFISRGDIDDDGLEDFFVGGPKGVPGKIFLQKKNGTFAESAGVQFERDKDYEDQGSVLFDADNDGDLDLYVVSGGSEEQTGSPLLQDRFYRNLGKGIFEREDAVIPRESSSGSCVVASDYDHDGDTDLFVGGKTDPARFPVIAFGGILRNDFDAGSQQLKFTVATEQVNPLLKNPGIVTNASWVDLNNDAWDDLIVVGDWMPIQIFMNNHGTLKKTEREFFDKTGGLWAGIVTGDFDSDGDVDFIVGNAGKNLPWKPTQENPMTLYSADYDQNGKLDPIICVTENENIFPIASRDELLEQLPQLKKKFVRYEDYAKASITDILSEEQIRSSDIRTIHTLSTTYFENTGNNVFITKALPAEVQFSKVQSIIKDDFNYDGNEDLVMAGNFYPYRVQYGISDASFGLLLLGNGKGDFKAVPPYQSKLYAEGDVRSMVSLTTSQRKTILIVGKNNGPLQIVKLHSPSVNTNQLTVK